MYLVGAAHVMGDINLLLWFTNFSWKGSAWINLRHISWEEFRFSNSDRNNNTHSGKCDNLYRDLYETPKRAIFPVSYINNVETLKVNQPSAKTKVFTKMMALVVGYLILSWSPYYVIIPLYKMNDPGIPTWYVYMFDIVSILLYTNSFMNPIIYSWQIRDFREAYVKILKHKRVLMSNEDRRSSGCTGNSKTSRL